MAVVNVAAGEFVFPSGVVKYGGGSIGLVDNSGGPNQGQGGDGFYTVSINSSGTVIVTKGREPAQSATLQHLAGAHVVAGIVRTIDRRMQNVTAATTNMAIMAQADADGSPIAAGMVTTRTLSPELLAALTDGGAGAVLPAQSLRAPTDFALTVAFAGPGTERRLSLDAGGSRLTLDAGGRFLLIQAAEVTACTYWVGGGGVSGQAVSFWRPDGTVQTAPALGSAASPVRFDAGAAGVDVYLVAYAVPNAAGTAYAITVDLLTEPPAPADLAPAFAAGAIPLVAMYGAGALLGATGTTSSATLHGGAGSGLAA